MKFTPTFLALLTTLGSATASPFHSDNDIDIGDAKQIKNKCKDMIRSDKSSIAAFCQSQTSMDLSTCQLTAMVQTASDECKDKLIEKLSFPHSESSRSVPTNDPELDVNISQCFASATANMAAINTTCSQSGEPTACQFAQILSGMSTGCKVALINKLRSSGTSSGEYLVTRALEGLPEDAAKELRSKCAAVLNNSDKRDYRDSCVRLKGRTMDLPTCELTLIARNAPMKCKQALLTYMHTEDFTGDKQPAALKLRDTDMADLDIMKLDNVKHACNPALSKESKAAYASKCSGDKDVNHCLLTQLLANEPAECKKQVLKQLSFHDIH